MSHVHKSRIAPVVLLSDFRRRKERARINRSETPKPGPINHLMSVAMDGSILFAGERVVPRQALAVVMLCSMTINKMMALHCREAL